MTWDLLGGRGIGMKVLSVTEFPEIPNESIARALHFLAPYRLRIALACTSLAITAAVTLVIVQAVRIAIDDGFIAGSQTSLVSTLVLLILATLVLAVGTFVRLYLVSWLGEKVTADIRKAVFKNLLLLDPSFFETEGRAEIQSTITTDTTFLQNILGEAASVSLRNTIMFIGATAFLFYTNWKLALVVVTSIPLIVVPVVYFGKKVRESSKVSQSKVAGLGACVGEIIKEIKTVQAYNFENPSFKHFGALVDTTFEIARTRIISRSLLVTFSLFLTYFAITVMFLIGGGEVIRGEMTLGELLSFVVYALILAGAIGSISQVIADILLAFGAIDRLMILLSLKSQSFTVPAKKTFEEMVRGNLNIKGLTFCYPSRPNVKALDNIDLSIPAGSSVALVGSCGAGKSTLFDLLLRFYSPENGVIELDDIDIQEISPSSLRDQFALVSQDSVIFTGTVRENIQFGNPSALSEDIYRAAELASVTDFVRLMPNGFDTYIGEAGILLS